MTSKKDRMANGVTNVSSARSKRPVTPKARATCNYGHSVLYKMAKIISLHIVCVLLGISPASV